MGDAFMFGERLGIQIGLVGENRIGIKYKRV